MMSKLKVNLEEFLSNEEENIIAYILDEKDDTEYIEKVSIYFYFIS